MTPPCPRCNYDLSGQSAAWHSSCPLESTCPECGLDFAWRDLLNPAYAVLPRSFEHADFDRPRAFRTTLLRTLRPRRFWRWLQLHHPINRARLLLFVPLAAAFVYAVTILFFIAWIVLSIIVRHQPRMPGYTWLESVLSLFTSELLWPFGTDWAWASGPSSAYTIFRPLELLALFLPFFMPLAFLTLPDTLRRARVRRAHLLRIAAYSLVPLPLILYAPELLYGVLYEIAFFTANWQLSWNIHQIAEEYAQHTRLAAILLWLTCWWGAAARSYLRLPHALAVSFSMAAIALLSAAVLLLALTGGWFAYDLV